MQFSTDKYTGLDHDGLPLLPSGESMTHEQKIKYLESIIKEISQRTWNIKNAIEWHKFTNPEH